MMVIKVLHMAMEVVTMGIIVTSVHTEIIINLDIGIISTMALAPMVLALIVRVHLKQQWCKRHQIFHRRLWRW
jgi:hypothetical protein